MRPSLVVCMHTASLMGFVAAGVVELNLSYLDRSTDPDLTCQVQLHSKNLFPPSYSDMLRTTLSRRILHSNRKFRFNGIRNLSSKRIADNNRFFHVSEEIRDAFHAGRPVVALETTIYTHGMLA
jgi:hypothetical protein